MSFNNTDPTGKDQKPRGWWSRKWKWCIPLLILGIMILGGAAFAMKYIGKRFSEPYKMTMAKIQDDQQAQEAFGQPIRDDSWAPAGEISELRWDLAGPKGKGKAYVKARLTKGKWEIVMIEVILPGGKKLVLHDESGGNDAPVFVPQGTAAPEKSQETAPPPDLNPNIPMPDETEPKK